MAQQLWTTTSLGWILFLLGSPAARADTASSSLSGYITDPSGAAIVGSVIEAREMDAGVVRQTLSTAAGAYQLTGLRSRTYEVTASHPQFITAKRTAVVLRVGESVRIDFSLEVGGSRENISVRESAVSTQVDTASELTVVNEKSVQDLPSDGRQLQNLALIVPGVAAGWNLSTAANRYGKARENTEGAFTINGARSRSNDFLFDGMPMNVRQYSVINFEPSNEAIQEFAVLSGVAPPEYGRTMGGQISIITRAGSNRFHASAYEFFRNDALNANDTIRKRSGIPRGTVRHNQFGGTLGGPIWKNRHFFFAGTELLRNLEASETRTSVVPTGDERRGLIRYVDPAGQQKLLDLTTRITPLSARLLSLYPEPNASLPSGNYNAALAIALNDYQYHVRTDHYITHRDVLTMRTSWNLNDQTYIIDRFGGPYIPGFPLPNPERTTNGTLGYMHTFSAQAASEARIGVNRYGNLLANGDQRNATTLGLPNGSDANGIPSIVFAQGGLAGLGGLSWYNREQNELTVYGSETVALLRGSHSMKFGADVSRHHYNTRGADNQRGSVLFDGSRNNLIPPIAANSQPNVMADLLLGLPVRASITTGNFGRGYRQWAWAMFAQDRWRATNRLTLEYGIRFEYSAPWTEVNGKLSNFVPGLGLIRERDANWRGLYRPDRNNFAPRLGVAYDVFGNGRTVIRGGAGVYYETLLQASTVQQIENNPPFAASATTTSPTPFSTTDAPSTTLLDLRAASQPSRSVAAVAYNLPNPYTLQTSFDIQQAIGPSWVVEVGYRGTRGVHLPYDYNINQVAPELLSSRDRESIALLIALRADTAPAVDRLRPYPNFNSILLFENGASSTHHSMQAKLEHRLRSGLNLLAGYTWSKSIDDSSDFASGDPSEQVLNSRNRRAQRAVASFDVPHRVTAAFNYLVPALRYRTLLGGWQLNGVITIQSGQPFTPYTSQFDPYRNESFNRLDVVGNPSASVPSALAYNPDVFRTPAPGTFGNSGRNIVRGDGYRSADLSVFRIFHVSEAIRLQLRVEAQNASNQVNYQGPITDQATRPGAFVAAAPARTIQLGAKLFF